MLNKKYIKPENYIVIQGFMLTEMGLKGVALLVYAIIYGFSQLEGQGFTGSIRYLEEFTGSSRPSVVNALKQLTDKGYIEKKNITIADIPRVEYRVTEVRASEESKESQTEKADDKGSKETLPYSKETCHEVVKKLNGGSKETLPNNINNNIIYNNINNNACARAYDCYEKNIGVIKECVMQEIDSYLDDGVEDEMICAAIEDAAKASRFTWHYINAILSDKVKKNIKTLSAYKADREAWENRRNTQAKSFSVSPMPRPEADELYPERKPTDEELADYMAAWGGGGK